MQRVGSILGTLLLLLLSLGIPVSAQTDRATITGTVKDPAGAVLPGAVVTATNTDTNAAFTSPTNDAGVYTIPSLPVGHYTLEVSHGGFKTSRQTGISPVAGQVITADVLMAVGTTAETVTVTEASELDTQSATVAMTMEPKAIEELPLNASGGRNALSLLLATASNVSESTIGSSGTQNWVSIAGGETFSNSIYIDGTNATAGNQGMALTPGQDALQEMQVQSNVTDAELAQTGGGAIIYVLKSGTNKLHGSLFEYLQNEDLNANQWTNNYFKSQCAPGDSACLASNSRTKFRFNDYGGSLGGPLWKNHTFAFGDFEYYKQSNLGINPTGLTVPLPQMMNANNGYYDFSPLLTMGSRTGPVAGSTNPCTGSPYNYGEVYDPSTWRTPAGAANACANPYPDNHIPAGALSSIGKSIASIYNGYYQKQQPLNRLIGGNFPSYAGGAGQFVKKRLDIKIDHNFSDRHHLSGSWNWQSDENDGPVTFGTQYGGPWGGFFESADHGNDMIRVIDNYTITPTLINNASMSFNVNRTQQQPTNQVDGDSYGFSTGQKYFPLVQGLSTPYSSGVNGVSFSSFGESWNVDMNFASYNYADTMLWQKGRHNVKFGWQWSALQQNSRNYNLVNNSYTFSNQTYGATDPAVSNYSGSGLAEMLMGNVNQTQLNGANGYYPRQKYTALFVQDDFKVTPSLTLNLGLRWDLTLPGHMASGPWENFDPNVNNPNWAPYSGAWVFSKGPSTTFQKNVPLYQFGPHLGMAYSISPRLVAKASYALTYVPLGVFSSGADDYRPSTQDPLSTATTSLTPLNNTVGEKALQWDNPYPLPVRPPQDSTATTFGDETGSRVIYIHPDFLKLGRTNTLYAGLETQLSKGMVLSTRYLGSFGRGLQDFGPGYDVSWPQWSAYHALLKCPTGNASTPYADQTGSTVGSPSNAASITTQCGTSVPYPYAGFSGPARAAIAPYPQLAASGTQLEVAGDTSTSASSNYNSFVAELRVRDAHGLYVNWSYTFSKFTTDSSSAGWGAPTNFSNVWGSNRQGPNDNAMWVVANDQRHLTKGYLTYDLPFGIHQRWLNQPNTLVNYAVGGWTIGYYGAYGSGLPIGTIGSPYKLNYYYGSNQRAVFANGASASNVRNNFPRKHFNPGNLTSSSNYDFDQSIVHTDSSWYYNNDTFFGNTPLTFNKWRWNSNPASENISLVKHFAIGSEGRYSAQLRGEFYNAFNRHSYYAPDINPNDSTFGFVTSVAGTARVGQIAARFEF